jgi:hypothetical protein
VGDLRRKHTRVLAALAVAGAVFGIASAVQADIPDNGIVQACYGKPGTPQRGQLRVRDADQGEQCRATENPISWGEAGATGPTGPTGQTGPTGPSGTSGPTSLASGSALFVSDSAFATVASHTVTAGEAGLTIITAPVVLADGDGNAGLSTAVGCFILLNGGTVLFQEDMVVSDNGDGTDSGDTTSATLLDRHVLATGDKVSLVWLARTGDSGEGDVDGQLLLQRVGS